MCICTNTVLTRLKNKRADIRLPFLQITKCDVSKKNESLGARKGKLVHEAGHVR